MKRFLPLLLLPVLSSCAPQKENKVVLYCSVDSVFARPLIADLEKKTGLHIDAVFDTEATKTAGLTTKIRSESGRPRADVFWSSALLQTLLLSEDGFLAKYDSPAARDLPSQFRGENWAGVGVRGRVLIENKRELVPDAPVGALSPLALQDDQSAISNPQFGTASDWFCALGARAKGIVGVGDANLGGFDSTLNWARGLKKGGVRILPGNGDVARLVADGTLQSGVTDTDDFLTQKPRAKRGFRVVETVKENVLVPGAVSIIQGAPHPENARKLFDAIVSAPTEAALVKQMPGVFSLRRLEEKSNWQSGGTDFSFLKTAPRDDYSKWPVTWRKLREPLQKILAN